MGLPPAPTECRASSNSAELRPAAPACGHHHPHTGPEMDSMHAAYAQLPPEGSHTSSCMLQGLGSCIAQHPAGGVPEQNKHPSYHTGWAQLHETHLDPCVCIRNTPVHGAYADPACCCCRSCQIGLHALAIQPASQPTNQQQVEAPLLLSPCLPHTQLTPNAPCSTRCSTWC